MKPATKLLFSILILVFLLLVLTYFSFPNHNLNLVSCNVGQGDATLIYLGTTQILIDGGPSNSVLECLDKHIPFWDRKIELVVLTHPQKDHYYGLIEVFGRYKVDKLLSNDLNNQSDSYNKLLQNTSINNTKKYTPVVGDSYFYKDLKLFVFGPRTEWISKDQNSYSIVLLLNYKNFSALFTGDMVKLASEDLSDEVKAVDVLKVPHHGSKNGLTQSLANSLKPKISVISSGIGNRYGHPHQEILQILESQNSTIYQTSIHGNINIQTDGESVKVLY